MSRAGHDIDLALHTDAEGNGCYRSDNGARGDLHNIHVYNKSVVVGDDTHVRFYVVDPPIRYGVVVDGRWVAQDAPEALRLILELTGSDKIPAIGERKTYNPVRRADNIGGDQEGVVRDEYVIRRHVEVQLDGAVGVAVPLPDPPDPLPADYVEPDPLPPDKSGQIMICQCEIHGEYNDNFTG